MTRESTASQAQGAAGGYAFSIIGGGTMGETICRSLLQNTLGTPDGIIVCEINSRRGEVLRASLGVAVTAQAAEAVAGVPVIFLAVKPQDFPSIAKAMQGLILPEQLVVSIMAGVSLHTLRDHLGHRAVVRAMPNTPAQIGRGMTVWTSSEEVTESQRAQVQTMLATMGREISVPDERQVDMATAVSGSGPGFIFLFLEALVDGAVQIGMRRELAAELVYQTVLGSAAFAQESGLHPAVLRDMVVSPGGTTAEGLRTMEQYGVRAATIEAIVEAYRRTQELGQ